MKHFRLLFLLYLCLIGLHTSGQNLQKYTLEMELDTMCLNQSEESNFPGLSVMIAYKGEIIFSKGYGYANIGEKKSVIPEKTLFRIGSISKSLTAAGLAQLVESNDIDLYAPIQKYVPYFPKKEYEISIKDLSCHLAGIRHYRGLEYLSDLDYPDVRSGIQIFQEDELIMKPKTRFKYSSYGWNLVSAAIEGASGEDFLSFMRNKVFIPLGMKNTHPEREEFYNENLVAFYKLNEDDQIMTEMNVNNSYKWAGGGFLSTSSDLIKFAQGIMNNQLYGPDIKELFWTSCTLADGSRTNYGLGWFENKDDFGRRTVGHSGGSVGGTSMLLMFPDEELVIVTLVNLSSAKTQNLANRLAAKILESQNE